MHNHRTMPAVPRPLFPNTLVIHAFSSLALFHHHVVVDNEVVAAINQAEGCASVTSLP